MSSLAGCQIPCENRNRPLFLFLLTVISLTHQSFLRSELRSGPLLPGLGNRLAADTVGASPAPGARWPPAHAEPAQTLLGPSSWLRGTGPPGLGLTAMWVSVQAPGQPSLVVCEGDVAVGRRAGSSPDSSSAARLHVCEPGLGHEPLQGRKSELALQSPRSSSSKYKGSGAGQEGTNRRPGRERGEGCGHEIARPSQRPGQACPPCPPAPEREGGMCGPRPRRGR